MSQASTATGPPSAQPMPSTDVPPPSDGAPRSGQLTTGWQIMVGAAWTVAFFAFSAVWKTSQDIGIGTWWLGARAQPQPVVIQVMPFVLTIVVGLAAIYNVRQVAAISLAGSLAVLLIASFDISRSGGLAAIEFAIAASLVLVTAGAFTGTYRASAPD